MPSAQTATLLPLSNPIDHFGQKLTLIKKIGEGYTSEVYGAELIDGGSRIRVAVKARKPLDYQGARENFEREAKTLEDFMKFEELANNKSGTPGLKIIPYFYGKNVYKTAVGEVDYIVMEFIDGDELPDLLKKVQEGHMPEKDALVAGWQFFRVLDILHTEFKKVFIDMKLENLWWVPAAGDNQAAQLKVTDLGTLAAIKETRDVEHDLLLGGIILCGLLTGYFPRYHVYGLNEPVEPVLENHKTSLSWGTVQVLRRILHRNPAQRYPSAEAINAELLTLAELWVEADEPLLDIAQANQEEGEKAEDKTSQETRDFARKARAALDILSRRSPKFKPDVIESAVEKADKLIQGTDYLASGKEMLLGGSWQKAIEMFEQGKEWTRTPAELRRWGYLARAMAGNAISNQDLPNVRGQAMDAVENLNAGKVSAARQKFQNLARMLNLAGVKILLAECDLAENIKNAEAASTKEQYEQATGFYKNALKALENLPDRKFIEDVELGDMQAAWNRMSQMVDTRGRADSLLKQASEDVGTGSFDNARKKLGEAYDADPQHPRLILGLLDAAGAACGAKKLEAAEAILAIGSQLPRARIPDEFAVEWQTMQALRSAQQSLNAGQHEIFARQVRIAYSIRTRKEHTSKMMVSLLEELGEKASQSKDAELLDLAVSLISEFGGGQNTLAPGLQQEAKTLQQEAKTLQQENEKKLQDSINRLVASATCLVEDDEAFLQMPAEQSGETRSDLQIPAARRKQLETARQYIRDAEQMDLYIQNRSQDIASLKQRIEQALSHLSERIESLDDEYNKLFNGLKEDWRRVEEMNAWILLGRKLGVSPDALDLAKDELGKLVRQTYSGAQDILARYSPPDVEMQQILEDSERTLNNLGPQAWQALAEKASKQAENLLKELDQALAAFEKGDIKSAKASVADLEIIFGNNPKFIQLRDKINRLDIFSNWQIENREKLIAEVPNFDLMEPLADFIKTEIPNIYWVNGPVKTYLTNLHKRASGEIDRVFRKIQSAVFVLVA